MTQHINEGEQEITLTGGYWGAKYSRDNPNGFRIKKADRDNLLVPLESRLTHEEVTIESSSGESPRLSLSLKVTPSFWRTCHEFRKREIGVWIEKRRENSWPKGKPPKYTAKLLTAGTDPIKIKVLPKK